MGVFELDTGAMLTIDTAWCTNGEELSVHGTSGRFTYRDNKLALCSSVGPYRGRVAQYSGGLVTPVRGLLGRRTADGGQASGVRRHKQPAKSTFAVPGSGARRTPRAGADLEAACAICASWRRSTNRRAPAAPWSAGCDLNEARHRLRRDLARFRRRRSRGRAPWTPALRDPQSERRVARRCVARQQCWK